MPIYEDRNINNLPEISDVTGAKMVGVSGGNAGNLDSKKFSKSKSLPIDFTLERGTISRFTPSELYENKRLYTKDFRIYDYNIKLEVSSGYKVSYHCVKADGTNPIESDFYSSIDVTIEDRYVGGRIRFVFGKSDDSDIDNLLDDVIVSYSGFYSDRYESGSEVKGIKNSSFLEMLSKKESEKENYIAFPCIENLNLWETRDVPNDFECTNDRTLVTSPLKYYEFIKKFYESLELDCDYNYSVTKKSLGRDSSGNYDVFEFDFKPKFYSRTILLSAGMNACETTAEVGLAIFMRDVVRNYNENNGLKYLHDNVRIKVIPVLCPWSFDQEKLAYTNYNGVNINRNFDYKGMWSQIVSQYGEWSYKGSSPESEIETKILRQWISDNANAAQFHIDCHTDVGNTSQYTFYTMGTPDISFNNNIVAAQMKIGSYLEAKGLGPVSGIGCGKTRGDNYPKCLIFDEFYGVPSMMIEQIEGDLTHGGNGNNCSPSSIVNYVMMIHAYSVSQLIGESQYVKDEDVLNVILNDCYSSITKQFLKNSSMKTGGLLTASAETNSSLYRKHTEFSCVGVHKVSVSVDSPYSFVEAFEINQDGSVTQHVDTAFTTGSKCKKIKLSIKKGDESIALNSIDPKKYNFAIDRVEIRYGVEYAYFHQSQIVERNDHDIIVVRGAGLCDVGIFVDDGYVVSEFYKKNNGSYVQIPFSVGVNFDKIGRTWIFHGSNCSDFAFSVKTQNGGKISSLDVAVNNRIRVFKVE